MARSQGGVIILPRGSGGGYNDNLHICADAPAGWAHRQTLLTYCLSTVHSSLEQKKAEIAGQEERLAAAPSRTPGEIGRRVRGVKEEEVFVSVYSIALMDIFFQSCPGTVTAACG